ncbi:MAG: hypothetical protein WCP14_02975 [bacterium]
MDIEFDKEIFNHYKYAIITGLAAFFIFIFTVFIIIIPLYQTASAKAKEAEAALVLLKETQEKEAVLNNLKSQGDELKKTSELLATALPISNDVGPLFIQLSALIVQNGGKVKGIAGAAGNELVATTTEQITSMVNLNKYTYVLPIEFSSYSKLKTFIDDAKQALRLIEISSITISSSDKEKINATITVVTYTRSK